MYTCIHMCTAIHIIESLYHRYAHVHYQQYIKVNSNRSTLAYIYKLFTLSHSPQSLCIVHMQYITYTGKFWWEKLANLGNRELFAKIFLANIHRYTENVYDICTDCSLFTKPIAFTCMVHQNLPCQIFPMYGILQSQQIAIVIGCF